MRNGFNVEGNSFVRKNSFLLKGFKKNKLSWVFEIWLFMFQNTLASREFWTWLFMNKFRTQALGDFGVKLQKLWGSRGNAYMLSAPIRVCVCAQSCPTLCNPIDCSLPGPSVHGLFQARILEWVVISYSRGSSPPRDRTPISGTTCISRHILYHCATWEAPSLPRTSLN